MALADFFTLKIALLIPDQEKVKKLSHFEDPSGSFDHFHAPHY
jgi:hypothetical protein